jgi:hypothetical protein
MTNEDITERAKIVQEKYQNELMSKANVVGTAVGLVKRQGQYTGEVAIVVMVQSKVPAAELGPDDLIPKELDGIKVDVQETGAFIAQ